MHFSLLYLSGGSTRDCNPESWDPGRFRQSSGCWIGSVPMLDFGITKFIKVVLFRVLHDANNNFGCLMHKIFYAC